MECSFTPKHYLESLNSAIDADYNIVPVSDHDKFKPSDRVLLLRHDVDLSLDLALDMALLEKDNGIRSTYYILLHSNLYNAMSPDGAEKVKAIRDAGHDIGLHIDTRYFTGVIEFEILSRIVGRNVIEWSKHLYTITSDEPLTHLKGKIGDTDNALKAGYYYISDSGMSWRNGCFCNGEHKQHDKIQLLVHPEWWMIKGNRWEVLEYLETESRYSYQKAFNEFREILKQRVIEIETITGSLPVSRNTSIS